MKVIILAGGYGTRLAEYTDVIPKPMVTIGGTPMLMHIMNLYAKAGFTEFGLALGYKSNLIKEYFRNFHDLHSDFTVDLSTGQITNLKPANLEWKITLIDTGLNTMTGGRLKRMEEFIDNSPFMLTYGDGIADIDIKNLHAFHVAHKKMVTVSAVRPPSRFGELVLDAETVIEFKEKSQINQGWINGGFFVAQPEFLQFINSDDMVLEKEPLENVSRIGELMAYQHDGFWQCMDTKRDRDFLEQQYRLGHLDVFYR